MEGWTHDAYLPVACCIPSDLLYDKTHSCVPLSSESKANNKKDREKKGLDTLEAR